MKSTIEVLDEEARFTTFSSEGNHILGHILFQPDGKEELRVELQYWYHPVYGSIRYVYYHPNPDTGSIIREGQRFDEYSQAIEIAEVVKVVTNVNSSSAILQALRNGARETLERAGIL